MLYYSFDYSYVFAKNECLFIVFTFEKKKKEKIENKWKKENKNFYSIPMILGLNIQECSFKNVNFRVEGTWIMSRQYNLIKWNVK